MKSFAKAIKNFFAEFKSIRLGIRLAGVLVLSIVFATLSMTAVYMLPTDRIEANLKKSVSAYSEESYHEYVIKDVTATLLDNYMDSEMLLAAMYDSGESAAVRAVKNYNFYDETKDYHNTLIEYFNADNSDYTVVNYGRYWHGYMVFLKPMLSLFSYNQLRAVNAVLQIILLAAVVYLMNKRGLKKYIIAFLSALLLIGCITIPLSLQYSWVFYLLLASLVCTLAFMKKLMQREARFIFFTVIGIVAAFSDLLTYPLVTVCVPLIFFIITDEKDDSYTSRLLLPSCAFWFVGYGVMWAGKWLVYRIVTGESIFANALGAVAKRTLYANEYSEGYEFGKYTFFDVLTNNFRDLIINPFIIAALICIVFLIRKMRVKGITPKLDVLPYGCVGIIPILWYFVLNNHSYIHSRYTFRLLMIPIFAVLCFLVNSVGLEREGIQNPERTDRHKKKKQR